MCGATRLLATHPRRRRSYPHIRGAYALTTLNHYVTWGLSPRVWGVRVYESSLIPYERAIPTCVGLTWRDTPRPLLSSSYPHVRGAYMAGYSASATVLELSPRAWGLRGRFFRNSAPAGAIPTCVGRTRKNLDGCRGDRSYPHVRGAYKVSFRLEFREHELSPRVWGLLRGHF